MLVARADSLAKLEESLAKAASGRGHVVLLRGEAGIGKSTLLAEAVRRAEAGQFRVITGKSWELGEAPPYFPLWSGLRALGLEPPASGADPFRLWEEVLSRLAAETSGGKPLLWAIEDLHAADLQTLDLLTFLVTAIASLRVASVATTRAADPRLSERSSQRLVRIGRDATTVDLAPFAEGDVASVAARIAGRELAPFEVAQLHQLTGGNPLFVVECARAFAIAGAAPRAVGGRTVRTVVAERVNLLPEATRAALAAAAILGREASAATIARMEGALPAQVIDALLPAVDAGIVSEARPGHFAFAHIVVRDAIEEMLTRERRVDLHARAEKALDGDGVDVVVERARHALAARQQDAVKLAMRATKLLEGLGAWDRALAMHERIQDVHAGTAPERLHMATVASAAGRFAMATELCREVIAYAQARGDGDLLARTALVLGSEIRPATVDTELVAALREAQKLLPEGPLKLRVMARLAAALQPADDPRMPIAMAHEAIAKARAFGDEAVFLDVLHVAVSAMIDYETPEIRVPIVCELLDRALAAGDLAKAVRAQVLYAIDLAAKGELTAWSAAVDDALELSLRVGHPRHRWRPLLLDSMRALAFGDVRTSDRRIVEVQRLAAITDDPALMLSLNAHLFTAARLLHRDDAMRAVLPDLAARVGAARHGRFIEAAIKAGIGARLEDRALVESVLDVAAMVPLGFVIDSLNASVAEGVAFAGSDALRREVLARWNGNAGEHVIGGVIPFTYEGPTSRLKALLEAALGDRASAERRLREGLGQVEALGFRAWIAQLSYDLGALIGDTSLLGRAAELAEEIGMPGLVVRARKKMGTDVASAPPAVAAPRFTLALEGDTWKVEHAGHVARVKDSRGMRMLARLVERAGEDVHVLVLASDDPSASVHDEGIGPALDDRARREYKERLDDLVAAIDQAEDRGDRGRIAKLRAERDALDAELRRAFGLGGKARPTSSASEKARVNVQRRLKDAIGRIGEHDPAAGRFLEKAVSTGIYCRFFA
jgi:hypothetical protein